MDPFQGLADFVLGRLKQSAVALWLKTPVYAQLLRDRRLPVCGRHGDAEERLGTDRDCDGHDLGLDLYVGRVQGQQAHKGIAGGSPESSHGDRSTNRNAGNFEMRSKG